MAIYGTAILAICFLSGLALGRLLGAAAGMDADLGGVGLAMLLLIGSTEFLKRRRWFDSASESGVTYWGALYVPIVVAMAASQNVLGALSGGAVAILAGGLTVTGCFVLVGLLARLGQDPTPNQE